MKREYLIIMMLALLLVIAIGYIISTQLSDYKIYKKQDIQDITFQNYTQGIVDGQLLLAAQQYQANQLTFFNGSEVRTYDLNKFCGG